MFKNIHFILFLILVSPACFSATFHILLSSEQDAPSPDEVVQEAQLDPPPPAYA